MIRGKHWAFHPAAGEPWVVRACHRCGYATAHCECTVVYAGSGRAKPPPPTSTPDLVHIIFGLFDHDRDGALDQREYGLFLCETEPENHALDLEKRCCTCWTPLYQRATKLITRLYRNPPSCG